jgi:Resolvase, N terminal domain
VKEVNVTTKENKEHRRPMKVHVRRGSKAEKAFRDTVYYSVGVYSQTEADGTVNGIPVFDQPWKNVVATFYHELNEARTDADVEGAIRAGNSPNANSFLGWISDQGEECGRRSGAGDSMTESVRGSTRFARSLKQLLNALELFRTLGIAFVSCTEAIDTSLPHGEMLFQIIGAIAQWERSLIVERVKAGLQHARSQGKVLGRPPLRRLTREEVVKLRKERVRTKVSFRTLAAKYGISVFTAHKLCVHSGRMGFSNLAAD